MMEEFGILTGLVIEKNIVLLLSLFIAVVTISGIDKEADWVYFLALTKFTRNWMKRKKRYWISFLPLHMASFAQAFAVGTWIYIINQYGEL